MPVTPAVFHVLLALAVEKVPSPRGQCHAHRRRRNYRLTRNCWWFLTPVLRRPGRRRA
jgi:hypothetical protein